MCTIVHKKFLIVHKKKYFMCTCAHMIFFRFYTLYVMINNILDLYIMLKFVQMRLKWIKDDEKA